MLGEQPGQPGGIDHARRHRQRGIFIGGGGQATRDGFHVHQPTGGHVRVGQQSVDQRGLKRADGFRTGPDL
ncbi:hypothetical protein GCM10029963_50650 [Micromonospora andamanensis]